MAATSYGIGFGVAGLLVLLGAAILLLLRRRTDRRDVASTAL
ncbi:LPXTG cell wall anchor domain-containing protein [Halorubrum vacuolatum]|nr:LPXTG cell wall anchor domain-containing protein [Halorubrum vacuolatum]